MPNSAGFFLLTYIYFILHAKWQGTFRHWSVRFEFSIQLLLTVSKLPYAHVLLARDTGRSSFFKVAQLGTWI
jgi:hypothetical protein